MYGKHNNVQGVAYVMTETYGSGNNNDPPYRNYFRLILTLEPYTLICS